MKNKLDEILLSDNVVENFHNSYNGEFKEWLNTILPEVQLCEKQNQDNPWHIYNCLDHILHSVQEINSQTKTMPLEERRKLAYVMFFHDIGKPDSHVRRYSKLYKREVDSFFNHNIKSKEIALRVMPNLGFSEKEQREMALLIEEHDIFMFITLVDDGNRYHKVLTDELVKDCILRYNDFGDGEKLLGDLIMVGRADNKAQNPKLTKDSLRLLDCFKEKLQNISQNCK